MALDGIRFCSNLGRANTAGEIYPAMKKLWPKLNKWYNFWF